MPALRNDCQMNQSDQRDSRSTRRDLPPKPERHRGDREGGATCETSELSFSLNLNLSRRRASEKNGTGPVDLLCSRNAPGFVCLVGWSFWSVWFFWMNFRSDQPDRRDRPDEPAFVGRAHAGDQPGHPSLRKIKQRFLTPFSSALASDRERI